MLNLWSYGSLSLNLATLVGHFDGIQETGCSDLRGLECEVDGLPLKDLAKFDSQDSDGLILSSIKPKYSCVPANKEQWTVKLQLKL